MNRTKKYVEQNIANAANPFDDSILFRQADMFDRDDLSQTK